eukprot:scaffold66629_cov70-Phaeocystis_antarctica.AAC.2
MSSPCHQIRTKRGVSAGCITARKRRGAHEAAIAHAMLLFGPARAFRRGVLACWFCGLALGHRGPPRGRRGRRGKARSAAPTALCAPRARRAQRCSRRSVTERMVRALRGSPCHGGNPPSLMKAGLVVHSPCVTHVSHLMSSSAHAPLPALAVSSTSHQPQTRRQVVALPSHRNQTRRQRQGATTAHKRRGAHEAAIAHAMLLLGPSRASLVVHARGGSSIAAEITRKRALFTHESVVELALPIPHPMLAVRGSVRASARDDHFFAGTDRVEDDQARVLADVFACRQMP